MTLTIIAHIYTEAGKEDVVRAELDKMIPTTQAEKGCIEYVLHVDNTDPTHFFFYETWESRDLWQDHMNSDHVKGMIEATKGAMKDIKVHEMTKQWGQPKFSSGGSSGAGCSHRSVLPSKK